MEQLLLVGVLVGMLALFVSGRGPYDLVALGGLLILAGAGVVPADKAFAGFGHPAVITVAAVLVISRAFTQSGIVRILTGRLAPVLARSPLAAYSTLSTVLSGGMNNVGAVAILLPAALETARRESFPPSRLLMPIAFGSLLGGMLTLISTPVNLLVSTFREESGGGAFDLFDFTPVGAPVALAGVVFLCLFGKRLLPHVTADHHGGEMFEISAYTFELRVPSGSSLAGRSLRDITEFARAGATLLGILRGGRRILAPPGSEQVLAGDVLLVESSGPTLESLLSGTRLELLGAVADEGRISSPDVGVQEAVVTAHSGAAGETARSLDLRRRYGVNLLAVARRGVRLMSSISEIHLEPGDVVLLQGLNQRLRMASGALSLLPLAPRSLLATRPRGGRMAVALFGVAILATAVGVLPVQVAFTAAAVLMVVLGVVSLRGAYEAIEWRILVLMGSMLPLGDALESTGLAGRMATGLTGLLAGSADWVLVVAVLMASTALANIMNNKAAVVLMAPVALSMAHAAGLSGDPFLMAVAIGAELVFLSPVGHQSNLLVMGPGGYEFRDFARLGLPLTVVCTIVAAVLIPLVWPLRGG